MRNTSHTKQEQLLLRNRELATFILSFLLQVSLQSTIPLFLFHPYIHLHVQIFKIPHSPRGFSLQPVLWRMQSTTSLHINVTSGAPKPCVQFRTINQSMYLVVLKFNRALPTSCSSEPTIFINHLVPLIPVAVM